MNTGDWDPLKEGPERWAGPHRRYIDQKTAEKPSRETPDKKRRKPRLRPGHAFMDPDELTPEERWDRIVELLAIMSMPEAPAAPKAARLVLTDKNDTR